MTKIIAIARKSVKLFMRHYTRMKKPRSDSETIETRFRPIKPPLTEVAMQAT
jgi:hypothetical protein